jgi:hypothetical protein
LLQVATPWWWQEISQCTPQATLAVQGVLVPWLCWWDQTPQWCLTEVRETISLVAYCVPRGLQRIEKFFSFLFGIRVLNEIVFVPVTMTKSMTILFFLLKMTGFAVNAHAACTSGSIA